MRQKYSVSVEEMNCVLKNELRLKERSPKRSDERSLKRLQNRSDKRSDERFLSRSSERS